MHGLPDEVVLGILDFLTFAEMSRLKPVSRKFLDLAAKRQHIVMTMADLPSFAQPDPLDLLFGDETAEQRALIEPIINTVTRAREHCSTLKLSLRSFITTATTRRLLSDTWESLQSLHLFKCDITSVTFDFSKLPALREVILHRVTALSNLDAEPSTAHLCRITRFEVCHPRGRPIAVSEALAVALAPTVRDLTLEGFAVVNLSAFSALTKLSMDNSRMPKQERVFCIERSPNLCELAIASNQHMRIAMPRARTASVTIGKNQSTMQITLDECQTLTLYCPLRNGALLTAPKLEVLTCDTVCITAADMELMLSRLPMLTHLRFINTALCFTTADAVITSSTVHTFEWLLTDDELTAERITGCISFPNLKTLRLTNVPLTSEKLNSFVSHRTRASVSELYLIACYNLEPVLVLEYPKLEYLRMTNSGFTASDVVIASRMPSVLSDIE